MSEKVIVVLSRAKAKLLSDLLTLASDQFSKHGCNDFDGEEYFTPAELVEFEDDLKEWNGGEDRVQPNMDWLLMKYFADFFKNIK